MNTEKLIEQCRLASDALHRGGIIAYPTEAVYGLGCDPHNASAVESIRELKRRSPLKSFIIIAANVSQLQPFIKPLTAKQQQLIAAVWPGPFTWVIPHRDDLPRHLQTANAKLAVRVTDHPVAKQLCQLFNAAIISTSANQSGEPPCRSAQQVMQQFPDLDVIIDSELGDLAQPTPIRDIETLEWYRGGERES